MPHTPVVPEMSHPAPNLEPLSAEVSELFGLRLCTHYAE